MGRNGANPAAAGTGGEPVKVAIAGFGAIGKAVASKLRNGAMPGIVLTAVASAIATRPWPSS